jgi:hypothetical protein
MLFQTPLGSFGASTFGSDDGEFGAMRRARRTVTPKKQGLSRGQKRKLRYSRNEAIAKFRRFRDEDRALTRAFAKGNTKQMARVLKRLAGARDRMYRKAYLVVEGKTSGQVTGRVILGIATHGLSEVVRLALPGKVDKARTRAGTKFQEVGDGAAAIYAFWMAKLKGKAKSTGKIKDMEAVEATEMQLQPGSPIAMAAADAVADFDENAPSPEAEQDEGAEGEGDGPSMADAAAVGLGALGAFLLAPSIFR